MDPLANPVAAVPMEELLAERTWVSMLARTLVGDHAQSDDLEQETWLSVVERPPAGVRSPRGWLATVLRRAAGKSRRSDSRRGARERAASRPEATASTVDVVVHAETHARVVRAVLELDEPYRTTVLLRFFEDLPPREVARRMGAPVETVRARSRRALEQLAARLEAHEGGRRAWVAALLPIATAPVTAEGATSLSWTGGLLVSAKAKAVIAAGVMALLWIGAVVWRPSASPGSEPGGSGAPPSELANVTPPPPSPPGLAVAPASAPKSNTESKPTTGGGPVAPLVPDAGARVHVRFVDHGGSDWSARDLEAIYQPTYPATGKPIAVRLVSDAALSGGSTAGLFATLFGPKNAWQIESVLVIGDDGTGVVDPKAPPGRWRLFVPRPGAASWLSQSFPAIADGDVTIAVEVERAPRTQRIRLVAGDTGAPLPGIRLRCFHEFGDDLAFLEGPGLVADANGEVNLPIDARSSAEPGRAASWWAVANDYAGLLPPAATRGPGAERMQDVRVAHTATVDGHAYLRSGKPASGCEIVSGRKGFAVKTKAAHDGSFRMEFVPVRAETAPGSVQLTMIEDLATARVVEAQVNVPPGGTARVVIGEPEGHRTTGRIRGRVTAGGHPLAGVLAMTASADRGKGRAMMQTDPDGRFEFDGVAPGPTRLMLLLGDARVSDDYVIQPAAPIDFRMGDVKEVEFDLPDGAIVVTVVDDATGKPVEGAGVIGGPVNREAEGVRFPGYGYRAGWSAFSDAAGRALLRALPIGEPHAVAAFSRDGREANAEAVSPNPSAAPTEVVLRMKPKAPK